jgi:hypothetical protein
VVAGHSQAVAVAGVHNRAAVAAEADGLVLRRHIRSTRSPPPE